MRLWGNRQPRLADAREHKHKQNRPAQFFARAGLRQ
jgi:hypothetical protein